MVQPAPPRPHRTTRLEAFLESVGYPSPSIDRVIPLRSEESDGLKAMGYGAPARVRFTSNGNRYDWVFRTAQTDAFGHEHDADRWRQLVLSRDTFDALPNHVRTRFFGVLEPDGRRWVAPKGEPFLVTDYVDGDPYANDLEALGDRDVPASRDRLRARILGRYLAELHETPRPETLYRRTVRDLVGDGEGIFGLTESYPKDDPIAPRSRLVKLETRAVRWRWVLFDHPDRCRRTHGDFHPFNLLFDADDELSVLDCSRGAAGEPADDLIALSLNYLFFAFRSRGELSGAHLVLWDDFWKTYLDLRNDLDALGVIAPFFAWRALVLASPAWYPGQEESTRDGLLTMAERLLDGAPFHPSRIQELAAG